MQSIFRILVFIVVYKLYFVFTLDYCKICKKGSHTLCKYQEGPSSTCPRYRKPELSGSVRKYILDVHNDIRNYIASGQETKGALGRQPPATNMNILQWDNELEDIAQRWADQCIPLTDEIQHDTCRLTGLYEKFNNQLILVSCTDRFDVGQNVLTAVTLSLELPDLAVLILNWYKQVHNVIPSDIEVFSGIQRGKYLIGQYTQLVWAETRYVGCGIASFQDINSTSNAPQYLHRLVCNYGPRGNVIGSPVYKKGIPCSKCPLGKCDLIRSNLCQGQQENKQYSTVALATSGNRSSVLPHNITLLTHSYFQQLQDNSYKIFNNSYQLNEKDILSLLPSITKRFNSSNIYGSFRSNNNGIYKPYHVHPDKHQRKQAVDILNFIDYYYNKPINFDLYQIEDGEVIVDECKKHQQLSQYEVSDSELIRTKHLDFEEITLPNGMVYKKVKGIWFHGRCRCNYVYRSSVSCNYFSIFLCVPVLMLLISK